MKFLCFVSFESWSNYYRIGQVLSTKASAPYDSQYPRFLCKSCWSSQSKKIFTPIPCDLFACVRCHGFSCLHSPCRHPELFQRSIFLRSGTCKDCRNKLNNGVVGGYIEGAGGALQSSAMPIARYFWRIFWGLRADLLGIGRYAAELPARKVALPLFLFVLGYLSQFLVCWRWLQGSTSPDDATDIGQTVAIHPFHHVPALVDGKLTLIESFAILDYLEVKFPTRSLDLLHESRR